MRSYKIPRMIMKLFLGAVLVMIAGVVCVPVVLTVVSSLKSGGELKGKSGSHPVRRWRECRGAYASVLSDAFTF